MSMMAKQAKDTMNIVEVDSEGEIYMWGSRWYSKSEARAPAEKGSRMRWAVRMNGRRMTDTRDTDDVRSDAMRAARAGGWRCSGCRRRFSGRDRRTVAEEMAAVSGDEECECEWTCEWSGARSV